MLLVLATALVGYDLSRGHDPLSARSTPPVAEPTTPTPPTVATPAITVDAVPLVAQSGAGTFQFATGEGLVAGLSGPILRYAVGVEDGVGVTPIDFAAAVETILGDPRSWTAGGTVRLQRVAGTAAPDFTIYLATPVTSEAMCRQEWLETGQYTNCRLSDGRVVINSARWLTAVPNYGAPLATYQAYAINHEVGHQLGHGHELCPGPGRPAPAMQPQTQSLDGCVAYAWPYLDGARYEGPPSGN
jgi:Protein of unknown function (DUF3152)